MAIWTVKNRCTNRRFVGMFDGESYPVEPGKTLSVPDYVAIHLKKQSIIRDNPADPRANAYLLAILEKSDDETPITEEEIPIESLDRSDSQEFRKVRYVRTKTGPATPARSESGGKVASGERVSH